VSCRPLKKARRHDGPVLSESYSFCCCVDVVLSSTSCIRLLPRLIVPVVLFRFLFLYQCLSFRPGCFRRRKGLQDCRVINVRICKTAFSSIFWSHVEKFTDSENASYYPRRLRRSALVGFSSPSVCLSVCLFDCLFVRSRTQKRMIPKCSKLVQGMTLGILQVTWLWVERSKVNVRITVNSSTAWVRTLWVPSSFKLRWQNND